MIYDSIIRTLGAVTTDPSWVTLTGTIDGVTGAVVGAAAAPETVLPKATAGTHCSQDMGVFIIVLILPSGDRGC